MSMALADVFKLSIYGLTAYVGVVLGMAEWGWVPFVSLPVTLLAYYLCEVRPRRQKDVDTGLRENPARLLAALALVASIYEFFSNNPEGKLLSGIHLVVYLTWVVLLQRKNDYRYWLLLALGVLQIAVSAVLTNATWLGLSMICYLFFAIWTLSVFTLYRTEREILGIQHDSDTPAPAVGSRLIGQSYNSVRFENGMSWVSGQLVAGTMATSMFGLFVGTLFFVLIPRVWVGSSLGVSDDVLPSALRRTPGLANEVRLGEMRINLESNDPVLRIRLFDHQTNETIDPQVYAEWWGHEAPYFRGAVLTEYDKGRWTLDRSTANSHVGALTSAPDNDSILEKVPTVRQEIQLDRINSDVLLCMARPIAMHSLAGNRCGRIQLVSELAVKRDWVKALPGVFDYVAYSELPPEEAKGKIGYKPARQSLTAIGMTQHVKACSVYPSNLNRLQSEARKIVDQEASALGRPPTNLEKARALHRHLRHSNQLKYSLSAAAVDSNADPVEDFLFNRLAGHCEYFASTLTLMLRAVDVPSRLVTGFKGGESRPDSFLYVEKRFSHAWVEAWLGDQRWTTLDPTPEAPRAESVTSIGANRSVWSAMSAQLNGIWESNVLDISYDRQESMVYGPVREWFTSVGEAFKNAWLSPRTTLTHIVLFLLSPRNWLSPGGLMLLVTLVAFGFVIRYRAAWFGKLGISRLARRADSRRSVVEFYERFSRMMGEHGHQRQPSQTQGEFVHEVADKLARNLNDPQLDTDLSPLGDLFYQVRFGDEKLSAVEKSQIDEVLNRLAIILARKNGHLG